MTLRDTHRPTPPEGHIAPVNGLQMYYEVHGEGRDMVLLHGFNVSGVIWRDFIPELSRYYRLIVPDLRGHGRTDNPPETFTHKQAGRDILALLDHLDVETFRAVGTSSGAMMLLHMATWLPERIEAMVLVAATYTYPESARSVMRQRTPDTLTEDIVAKQRAYHFLSDDQIRSIHNLFHSFKDSHDDMDLTLEGLSRIPTRTLVVHGDHDTYFPVSIPLDIYRALPNACLWIVPSGGHIPIHDHAEAFTRIVLEFFGGQWKH